MKKHLLLGLLVFFCSLGNAQILDPVKWTTKIEQKSATNFIITFNATIENEWHVYSQFTPDGGPLPLEVNFKNQKGNYTLVGKAKESKTRTAYNDIFEVNETFFEKKAQITQEISLVNKGVKTIEVELNFQACKEVCINLEKKFSIAIPELKNTATTASPTTPINDLVKDTTAQTIDSATTVAADTVKDSVTTETSQIAPAKSATTEHGLWAIFFIAFLSGFAALSFK